MPQNTVKNFFNPIIRPIAKPIEEFIKLEQASSIILMLCTIISLGVANSMFSSDYLQIWDTNIALRVGSFHLEKTVAHFIDDFLMAIFFLLVGLEIKREVLEGQLSSFKKALLPLLCAVGGMLFPALIFSLFNANSEYAKGWGIPTATDIAFSMAVISLLGNRVPLALKVFLIALAIADDLGAVIVIALFYTAHLDFNYLYMAAISLIILIGLNTAGIKQLVVYWIVGAFLWYFTLKSGIHATISGVLFAFCVPFRTEYSKKSLLEMMEEGLEVVKTHLSSSDVKPRDITEELEELANKTSSPSQVLENHLHGFVAYIIMPVFALCNTGFLIGGNIMEQLTTPISWGIMGGLVLGKPMGIFITAFIAVKLKIASLPENVTWKHIFGAGMLAGIGFTMSIFITLLAFPEHLAIQSSAKFSILIASLISGIAGFLFLRFIASNTKTEINIEE
jgi:NhaA family Na+:H+ antiporter